jgi:nucleoside-diphosphate-sugar epimerase
MRVLVMDGAGFLGINLIRYFLKKDYQAVLDTAGFRKKIIGLPAAPAILVLRILEKLGISPLYKWVYETASKYSNKEALIRNYTWYVDHIDQFAGQSGVTHRMPWKQGILGLAKHFF